MVDIKSIFSILIQISPRKHLNKKMTKRLDEVQALALIRLFRNTSIHNQYGYRSLDQLSRRVHQELEKRKQLPIVKGAPATQRYVTQIFYTKYVSADVVLHAAEICLDIIGKTPPNIDGVDEFRVSTKAYIRELLKDVSHLSGTESPSLPEHLQSTASAFVKPTLRVADTSAPPLLSDTLNQGDDTADVDDHPAQRAMAKPTLEFSNWLRRKNKGAGLLQSGVYQIFRRYKPVLEKSAEVKVNSLDPQKHAVICEVGYLSIRTMTCILVTAQGFIYHGKMVINHRNILSIVFERQGSRGIHYRYLSCLLWEEPFRAFSGILTKIGDTTKRPLAAECLIHRIPRSRQDEPIYNALRKLAFPPSGPIKNQINKGDEWNVIMNYITNVPPIGKRTAEYMKYVKYVEEFPLISKLSTRNDNGVTLFREPTRSLSKDDHLRIDESEIDLSIFRRSDC